MAALCRGALSNLGHDIALKRILRDHRARTGSGSGLQRRPWATFLKAH